MAVPTAARREAGCLEVATVILVRRGAKRNESLAFPFHCYAAQARQRFLFLFLLGGSHLRAIQPWKAPSLPYPVAEIEVPMQRNHRRLAQYASEHTNQPQHTPSLHQRTSPNAVPVSSSFPPAHFSHDGF